MKINLLVNYKQKIKPVLHYYKSLIMYNTM